MTYAALFAAMLLAGVFDAVCDGIKDVRTHLSAHPYRDVFHLSKHAARLCLLTIGALLPGAWWDDPVSMAITVVCGLVMGKLVWDAVYKRGWDMVRLDERVKITTGWKWLDKWLGLHW